MNNFYSVEELEKIGFKSFGKDVLISKKASIYGAENITLGNNVRIDDFCILSGKIEIGNNVHISAYVALYGKFGIKIGNYCGCSPRTIVFSATDDFSGEYMISPLVPEKYTNVTGGQVVFEDFVQLGANTIVMPNVKLSKGSATGAYTFVKKDLEEWIIYGGIPARELKKRSRKILKLCEEKEKNDGK